MTAALAATAAGVARSAPVAASGGGIRLIEPIPATLDFFGIPSHVQAPPLTGADTDASTVFNFKGATGIAFINGLVDRRDRRTGETRTLPFLASDMRYMKGVVRDRLGHQRHATFAFI
jgi:hypothetical protein